jgi:hypothetical protein
VTRSRQRPNANAPPPTPQYCHQFPCQRTTLNTPPTQTSASGAAQAKQALLTPPPLTHFQTKNGSVVRAAAAGRRQWQCQGVGGSASVDVIDGGSSSGSGRGGGSGVGSRCMLAAQGGGEGGTAVLAGGTGREGGGGACFVRLTLGPGC